VQNTLSCWLKTHPAVKYFEVWAAIASLKELEAILLCAQMPAGVRNVTLLALVKPLFQFVKSCQLPLPEQSASHPLPKLSYKLCNAQEQMNCCLPPYLKLAGSPVVGDGTTTTFRTKLVAALQKSDCV